MKEYNNLSIETHLFFARIMKKYALFLLAAIPKKNVKQSIKLAIQTIFLRILEQGQRGRDRYGFV